MLKKIIPHKYFQITNEPSVEKQRELHRYFQHQIYQQSEDQAQHILLNTLREHVPEYQNSELQQLICNNMIEYKQFNANRPRRISGRISYDIQSHQQKVQLQALSVVNQFDSVQMYALNIDNFEVKYKTNLLAPTKNVLLHQNKYKLQQKTTKKENQFYYKTTMKFVSASAKHNIFNIKEKKSIKVTRYDDLQNINYLKAFLYASVKMNFIKNTLGVQLLVHQDDLATSKFNFIYRFSGQARKSLFKNALRIVNYLKVKFVNFRPKQLAYSNIIALNPFNLFGVLKQLENYGFLVKLMQHKASRQDKNLAQLCQDLLSGVSLQLLCGVGDPHGVQLLYDPTHKKVILDFAEY